MMLVISECVSFGGFICWNSLISELFLLSVVMVVLGMLLLWIVVIIWWVFWWVIC